MSYYDLIKGFEGFREEAYQDGTGWSIGYGNQTYPNGKPVKQGDKINKENADLMLRQTADGYANAVKKLVKQPLNDNQISALTSFTYNVGVGAFQKSTLLKKLNQGDYQGAAAEFGRWNQSLGKELPGLVTRRQKEANIFMGGVVPTSNAPNSQGIPPLQNNPQTQPQIYSEKQKNFLKVISDPNSSLQAKQDASAYFLNSVLHSNDEQVDGHDVSDLRDHVRQLGTNPATNLTAPPTVRPSLNTPPPPTFDWSHLQEDEILDNSLRYGVDAEDGQNIVKQFGTEHPWVKGALQFGSQMGGTMLGAVHGARLGAAFGPWGVLGGGVLGGFMGSLSGSATSNFLDEGRFSLTKRDVISSAILAPFIGLGPAITPLKSAGILTNQAALNTAKVIAGDSVGAVGVKGLVGNASIQGGINVAIDNAAATLSGDDPLTVGENLFSFGVGAGTKLGLDLYFQNVAKNSSKKTKELEQTIFPNRAGREKITTIEPIASRLDPQEQFKIAQDFQAANDNRLKHKNLELDSTESLQQRVRQTQQEIQFLNILEEGTEPSKIIRQKHQELLLLDQSRVSNEFNAKQQNATEFFDPVLNKKISDATAELNKVYETLYPNDPLLQATAKDYHFKTLQEGVDVAKKSLQLKTEIQPSIIEMRGRDAQAKMEAHKRVESQSPYFNESQLVQSSLNIDPKNLANVKSILNDANLTPKERQDVGNFLYQLETASSIQDGDIGDFTAILNAVRNDNPLMGATIEDLHKYMYHKQYEIGYKAANGESVENLVKDFELVKRITSLGELTSSSMRGVTVPTPVAQLFKENFGDAIQIQKNGDKHAFMEIAGASQYAKGVLPEVRSPIGEVFHQFNKTLFELETLGVKVGTEGDPFQNVIDEVGKYRKSLSRNRKMSKEAKTEIRQNVLNKAVSQASVLQRLEKAGLTLDRAGNLQIQERLDGAVKSTIVKKLSKWNDEYLNSLVETAFGKEYSLGPRGERITYTRVLNELHAYRENTIANTREAADKISTQIGKKKSLKDIFDNDSYVKTIILSEEARVLAERQTQKLTDMSGFQNAELGGLTDYQKLQSVKQTQLRLLQEWELNPAKQNAILEGFINKYENYIKSNAFLKSTPQNFQTWFFDNFKTKGGFKNGKNIFSEGTSQARFTINRMAELSEQLPSLSPLKKILIQTGNLFAQKRTNLDDLLKLNYTKETIRGHAEGLSRMLAKSGLLPDLTKTGRSPDAGIIKGVDLLRRIGSGLSRLNLVSQPMNALQVAAEERMFQHTQNKFLIQEMGGPTNQKPLTKEQKAVLKSYGYGIIDLVTNGLFDKTKPGKKLKDGDPSVWLQESRDDILQTTTGLSGELQTLNDPKSFTSENIIEGVISGPWRAVSAISHNNIASKALQATDEYIARNLPNANSQEKRELFESFYYDLLDRSKSGLRSFIASGMIGDSALAVGLRSFNPAEMHAYIDRAADQLLTDKTPIINFASKMTGTGVKLLNDFTFRFTGWYPEVVRRHTDIMSSNYKKYVKLSNSNQKLEAIKEFAHDLSGYLAYSAAFTPKAILPIAILANVLNTVSLLGEAQTPEEKYNAVSNWSLFSKEIPGFTKGPLFNMDKFDSGIASVLAQISGNGDVIMLLSGLAKAAEAGQGRQLQAFTGEVSKTMAGRSLEGIIQMTKAVKEIQENPQWTDQEKAIHLADRILGGLFIGANKNFKRATGLSFGALSVPTKSSIITIANKEYDTAESLWMDEESLKYMEEHVTQKGLMFVGAMLGLYPEETMEHIERSALEINSNFVPKSDTVVNKVLEHKTKTAQKLETL